MYKLSSYVLNTSSDTYSGMRLDMERWFVVALVLSTGMVRSRRLAKTRLLLRGELGLDLVDERHLVRVVVSESSRVSRAVYEPLDYVRHRPHGGSLTMRSHRPRPKVSVLGRSWV